MASGRRDRHAATARGSEKQSPSNNPIEAHCLERDSSFVLASPRRERVTLAIALPASLFGGPRWHPGFSQHRKLLREPSRHRKSDRAKPVHIVLAGNYQ